MSICPNGAEVTWMDSTGAQRSATWHALTESIHLDHSPANTIFAGSLSDMDFFHLIWDRLSPAERETMQDNLYTFDPEYVYPEYNEGRY